MHFNSDAFASCSVWGRFQRPGERHFGRGHVSRLLQGSSSWTLSVLSQTLMAPDFQHALSRGTMLSTLSVSTSDGYFGTYRTSSVALKRNTHPLAVDSMLSLPLIPQSSRRADILEGILIRFPNRYQKPLAWQWGREIATEGLGIAGDGDCVPWRQSGHRASTLDSFPRVPWPRHHVIPTGWWCPVESPKSSPDPCHRQIISAIKFHKGNFPRRGLTAPAFPPGSAGSPAKVASARLGHPPASHAP